MYFETTIYQQIANAYTEHSRELQGRGADKSMLGMFEEVELSEQGKE
jgi:hypothetical protein